MKIYKDWTGTLYLENELSSNEDGLITPKRFKAFEVEDMPENIVILENNKFLIKDYGKYSPNVCFISNVPRIPWEDATRLEFNLPNGDLKKIRGEYFVSKKGTKCFRVDKNGHHLIISDGWGGAFNDYRGHTLPEDSIYFRRASSNGGGCGMDYAVVPIGWRMSITEDDI